MSPALPRRVRSFRATMNQRGFTLVEMMAVVLIMGILAVLAVVGYSHVTSSARMSEATGMIMNIRAAQERYHAETQQYADISNDLLSTYPTSAPGAFKVQWGASCTNCKSGMNWSILSIQPDGPLAFGYATVGGEAGSTPPSITANGTTFTFPASATDWFLVSARGDTNGNGVECRLYGSSYTHDLIIEKEGE